MQLILPMSGRGRRFVAAGHTCPKPLVDIDGAPMIARVLSQYPVDWPTTFVIGQQHMDSELPATLDGLRPGAQIVVVAPHDEGPGRALEAALPHVATDDAVFVSYCDFGLVWDPAAFLREVANTQADACVVHYTGYQPHFARPTRYATSRMDPATEQILEVREKGSFAADPERDWTQAGAFFFRNKALLGAALAHQRALGLTHQGELYTSLTIEALRRLQPTASIRGHLVEAFYQWGTPEDVADFVYWHRAHRSQALARELGGDSGGRPKVAQVLMPMAGVGSRFRKRTHLAKPLILVAGEPMFGRALASLPVAIGATVLVVRASEAAAVSASPHAPPKAHIVDLPAAPAGQALSTLAGLGPLNDDQPVLVSACDHAIGLDAARWARFAASPACEAAIFTATGYPGAARRPQSYSWVQLAPTGRDESAFPEVVGVSVKQPLSDQPAQDPLLVGTFWFASVRLLRSLIEQLVAEDVRVNGEYYLDSALALLLGRRATVRAVELTGYFNWGAPDAFDETCYYERALAGRDLASGAA